MGLRSVFSVVQYQAGDVPGEIDHTEIGQRSDMFRRQDLPRLQPH